ncbi:MAG: lysophospholipid acyltransferase family protein [Candidatus Muirbacterium halophilum]|nr:lysophospholipid acyltransferase family protein [Candidatus Muirbacterium halophilum]MCK9477596.1 lysophospholipid acyltransferase family protein [Candidatus Muirbacterium halophilum]
MRDFFLANLFRIVSFLIWITLRVEIKNHSILTELLKNKKSFILSFWHGEQFALTRFMKNFGLYILTSMSRDGETQTKILSGLGYKCVRGSSSKGGMKAILQLIKIIKNEDYAPVAMAVDGPKGPIYEPKDGFLYLAKKTSIPILPVRVEYKNAYMLKKAWDKYQFPIPFSKIIICFSDIIEVNEHDDIEQYKEKFKNTMLNLGENFNKD